MEKFGVTDPNDIYELENPTHRETMAMFGELDQRLRTGRDSTPRENFLVICLFAGHGVLKDGAQCLIYNEYAEKTKFYRVLTAEKVVRGTADAYNNAYMVCIFACCRQLYKEKDMENQAHFIQNPRVKKLAPSPSINPIKSTSRASTQDSLTRGFGDFQSEAITASNFLLMWGCSPSK